MEKKTAAYEKLRFYQDICEIRRAVYLITERFAKSHMRLVSQMRDAARSASKISGRVTRKGLSGSLFIVLISVGGRWKN